MTVLAKPDLLGLAPPTQLAECLLPPMKRQRVPFDDAWALALEQVLWPGSLREEKDWRAQLEATRFGWRAAYEAWPQERTEEAIAALTDGLDDLEFSDAA